MLRVRQKETRRDAKRRRNRHQPKSIFSFASLSLSLSALSFLSFDVWSDSMGSLHTDCPYPPRYPSYVEPQACYPAAQDFIEEWLNPIAIAAIVIGSIEVRTEGEIHTES